MLSVDTTLSTEGYFVLNWEFAKPGGTFLLQQSNSAEFTNPRTRPLTRSGSLTLTGLRDGNYFFRLAEGAQPVTAPVKVEVRHHSLAKAGLVFSVGLVLFVTLIITIAIGRRRQELSRG